MPDEEIIRLDSNDFEKILNEDAVKKRQIKKPTERKKKIASETHSAHVTEKNGENDMIYENWDEVLDSKPRKTSKTRMDSDKKVINADIKQLFDAMDSLIRKATIKSITKTLKDLQLYLDHNPEPMKNESDKE